MSEKFCLKWNDFQSNVSKTFGLLRNENYFYDVTLVSDDNQQVSAHRLVLSACSEYFKNIFRNNKNHQHPLICLDGTSSKDLNNVLDYIYKGELQIYQEDLDRFLLVAKKLKLEGLIGGDVQNHEEKIDFKEEVGNNEEFYGTEEEPKNNQKPQLQLGDGILSMNENGSELNEIEEKINEHIEKTQDGNYQCKVCGKVGGSRYIRNMKNHIETHLEGLSFPCQICGKTFRSRHTLYKHRAVYHS